MSEKNFLSKLESQEFNELDGQVVFPDFVQHGKQCLNQVDMMPRSLKHLVFYLKASYFNRYYAILHYLHVHPLFML